MRAERDPWGIAPQRTSSLGELAFFVYPGLEGLLGDLYLVVGGQYLLTVTDHVSGKSIPMPVPNQ